jgi:transcriptional regulator with GAF, ATPase, and Fis domain
MKRKNLQAQLKSTALSWMKEQAMTTGGREKKHGNHTPVFKSESMRNVFETVRKVAPTDAPVLILGESGVGKELVARAIHEASGRNYDLFNAFNCSALNDNLLESELFGHEKGSYTNATQNRKGLFECSRGGTIFFDEIGDMSPSFQRMLLRVIQENEFTRVGGNVVLKTDARILAATNKDLDVGVKDGWFREDLYFRLNVVAIFVPPLRERRADIPPLIDHFIAKYDKKNDRVIRGISKNCLQMLLRYDYPGNVRDLENIIQHAVIFAESPLLDVRDLPKGLVCGLKPDLNASSYVSVETESLLEALKQITIFTQKGQEKLWCESLRCIFIHDIHRFLVEQGNKWFSRKRFEEFLRTCSDSDRSKYKTAGVYLRILKTNRILKHNERKANVSKYCLANFCSEV